MTDHAITRAALFGPRPHRPSIARLVHNWVVRRQLRDLAAFDDRQLDDIGVTRGEIEWAMHLPLAINSALALEDRSDRRRRRENGGRRY